MRLRSRPVSPYRLYLLLESGMSFLLGITYATITVYWVTAGRLSPLQLLLMGLRTNRLICRPQRAAPGASFLDQGNQPGG
jgi:hypothetical protein